MKVTDIFIPKPVPGVGADKELLAPLGVDFEVHGRLDQRDCQDSWRQSESAKRYHQTLKECGHVLERLAPRDYEHIDKAKVRRDQLVNAVRAWPARIAAVQKLIRDRHANLDLYAHSTSDSLVVLARDCVIFELSVELFQRKLAQDRERLAKLESEIVAFLRSKAGAK